jgi:hypothetical protein
MGQLNVLLRAIGLRCVKIGKTRAVAVTEGRTVHRYRLDKETLKRMSELVAARKRQDAWRTFYEVHSWDPRELEERVGEVDEP